MKKQWSEVYNRTTLVQLAKTIFGKTMGKRMESHK